MQRRYDSSCLLIFDSLSLLLVCFLFYDSEVILIDFGVRNDFRLQILRLANDALTNEFHVIGGRSEIEVI